MNVICINDKEWQEKVADSHNWAVYRRKRYQVKIQKAIPDKEYNVPGKKGVVYNCLEDSEEPVEKADYVMTGLVGEMWPIAEKYLSGYEAQPSDIEEEPKEFYTRISDRRYFAIHIPAHIPFSVNDEMYGVLKGNSNTDRVCIVSDFKQ